MLNCIHITTGTYVTGTYVTGDFDQRHVGFETLNTTWGPRTKQKKGKQKVTIGEF